VLYILSYGSIEKWCARAVLPRLPPQCQCGDLLLIYQRIMFEYDRTSKWLPQMDSHHQPPDPKSGALLIELQGNVIRQPELHRSLADTSGVRRYQRFGGIEKWSGTPVLPRVSRRSERRGLLSSSCPRLL
jgi:hypothetical protein